MERHPLLLTMATRPTAETTCPNWPSKPVSWVTRGVCLGGNQAGTSRIAAPKMKASPHPTRTRASTAPPTLPVSAMTT